MMRLDSNDHPNSYRRSTPLVCRIHRADRLSFLHSTLIDLLERIQLCGQVRYPLVLGS
jgi:hypothetical protein